MANYDMADYDMADYDMADYDLTSHDMAVTIWPSCVAESDSDSATQGDLDIDEPNRGPPGIRQSRGIKRIGVQNRVMLSDDEDD